MIWTDHTELIAMGMQCKCMPADVGLSKLSWAYRTKLVGVLRQCKCMP